MKESNTVNHTVNYQDKHRISNNKDFCQVYHYFV